MYFTGVGSRIERATPQGMTLMTSVSMQLARAGLTGRSGAATGIDTAVETGIDMVGGSKEIYLPWRDFNNSTSQLHGACQAALALAATVHPTWETLSQGPRKMHGRNMYQVLGKTLDKPSLLTVCWTPDGCESERQRTRNTGGTASAIVLSERNGIPVFNLNRKGSLQRLANFLATHGIALDMPDEPPEKGQTALF